MRARHFYLMEKHVCLYRPFLYILQQHTLNAATPPQPTPSPKLSWKPVHDRLPSQGGARRYRKEKTGPRRQADRRPRAFAACRTSHPRGRCRCRGGSRAAAGCHAQAVAGKAGSSGGGAGWVGRRRGYSSQHNVRTAYLFRGLRARTASTKGWLQRRGSPDVKRQNPSWSHPERIQWCVPPPSLVGVTTLLLPSTMLSGSKPTPLLFQRSFGRSKVYCSRRARRRRLRPLPIASQKLGVLMIVVYFVLPNKLKDGVLAGFWLGMLRSGTTKMSQATEPLHEVYCMFELIDRYVSHYSIVLPRKGAASDRKSGAGCRT